MKGPPGKIEAAWRRGLTRRGALAGLAGLFAGLRLLRGQQDPNPLSRHRRAPDPDEMRDVWDFEAIFNDNLPKAVADYTAHGDGTEWTVRRNRQAFDWVDILPAGKPVDAASVDLSTEVGGTRMRFPVMIAPTARHGPLHPDAEIGTYRGATAAGAPYIVSAVTDVPLPKIAAAADGPLWFQLYGVEKAEANRAVLETAQEAGCQAVVITADQVASYYPRSLHDRFLRGNIFDWKEGQPLEPSIERHGNGPGAIRYGVETLRLWYNWDWVDQVRKHIHVPVLMKGIVTAEDARLCAARGLGVIVSNHGGRSLDYEPSTLEVLPEIVEIVRGRVPVLFDSGVRRGGDAFKALALGADAICLGRVPRWGLGAFGAEGVQRVLQMVQGELAQTAAAAGCARRSDIVSGRVKTHFA